MEITVRLNVRADADPVAVAQFLEWGRRLDAGPTVTHGVAVGDMSRTVTGPAEEIERAMGAGSVTEQPHEQPTWTGPAAGGLTPVEAAAAETPPAKPAGRRRRGAGTAAEQAEALGAPATTVVPQAPPQSAAAPPSRALPPGVQPGGFAIPPGASPPGAQPTTQQPQPAAQQSPPVVQQPEPAAAMPAAVPPSAPAANGAMALEDFKAEANAIYAEAQAKGKYDAYPFNVWRRATWPDGAAKPFTCISADSVPPEFRRRVLDECLGMLMKA